MTMAAVQKKRSLVGVSMHRIDETAKIAANVRRTPPTIVSRQQQTLVETDEETTTAAAAAAAATAAVADTADAAAGEASALLDAATADSSPPLLSRPSTTSVVIVEMATGAKTSPRLFQYPSAVLRKSVDATSAAANDRVSPFVAWWRKQIVAALSLSHRRRHRNRSRSNDAKARQSAFLYGGGGGQPLLATTVVTTNSTTPPLPLPSPTANTARNVSNLRTELRVARTIGIVVGCFVASWLPFSIIYLLQVSGDLAASRRVQTKQPRKNNSQSPQPIFFNKQVYKLRISSNIFWDTNKRKHEHFRAAIRHVWRQAAYFHCFLFTPTPIGIISARAFEQTRAYNCATVAKTQEKSFFVVLHRRRVKRPKKKMRLQLPTFAALGVKTYANARFAQDRDDKNTFFVDEKNKIKLSRNVFIRIKMLKALNRFQTNFMAIFRRTTLARFQTAFQIGFSRSFAVVHCFVRPVERRAFCRFAFWLGYSNSAVNPLLYAVCSRQLRSTIRRVLFERISASMRSS